MADLKISQLPEHTTADNADVLAIVDNTLVETKKISVSNLLASKQDSLGFTPEDVANKENATIDTSTTKYPTVNLLKTGLDAKIDKSIVNAKGDILTATADDTPARLAVGTDGQVLTADSNEATGLKYTTPLSASSTNTLTNKRITKRVSSTTSTSTLTPDSDAYDVVKLTAQAEALTIAAPTGTPTDGQPLLIQIVDNGTARALTWNAAYVAMGAALPTTTTISKILQVGCIWDAGTSKWLASSIQQV